MRTYYLLIAACLLISCKQRFYRMPSNSMAGTIKVRQIFTVTKTDKFERNDIAEFEIYTVNYAKPREDGSYPENWQNWVFRIAAYSGDSFEMRKGEVYVNGQHIPLPPKAIMRYEVLSREPIDEFVDMGEEASLIVSRQGDTIKYSADLTSEQVQRYRGFNIVISVKKELYNFDVNDTLLARMSEMNKWTPADYGPIRIPSPGETIEVNDMNFKMYRNIPDIKKGPYTIKEKLYFVLADNRFAAMDSRYIGLISHSKMRGIVK